MTTHYIDPGVASAGDGSIGSPWRTPPGTLVAGDAYLVRAGRPIVGAEWLVSNSGESGSPIYIGAYGDGDVGAVMDGAGTSQYGLRFGTDCHHVVVEDFEFIGQTLRSISNGTTGSSEAVETNLTFRRIRIHDLVQIMAVDVDGVQLFGRYNTIEDMEIWRVPTDGIWIKGNDFIGRGLRIREVEQTGLVAGDCIQFGGTSSNFLVEDSVLDHSDMPAKQALIVNGSSGSGGKIRGVRMYGHADSLHIVAYINQPNVSVENCEIYGGYGSISLIASGCSAVGNYVQNEFGIGIDAGGQDVVVMHNRVRGMGAGVVGIRNNTTSTGISIKRNEIDDFTRGIQIRSANESFNAVWDCGTAFSDQSGNPIGAGEGSISTAPEALTVAGMRSLSTRRRLISGFSRGFI